MEARIAEYDKNNIYTCSFCGKKAQGKPLSWLKDWSVREKELNKSRQSVALMPDGWDWDIAPVKFTDQWSCGCHKFR